MQENKLKGKGKMKEKDKNLLLKDLCARLYTGTIVNYDDTEGCDYPLNLKTLCNFPEEKLKCYLRPMSSMTEEEEKSFRKWQLNTSNITFDWFDAHHFDYRGLIEKGLALSAPKGMYKTEEL